MQLKMISNMIKLIAGVLMVTTVVSADPAPDYDYVDLEGNMHNMNTYVSQGKYIAYDFVTLD